MSRFVHNHGLCFLKVWYILLLFASVGHCDKELASPSSSIVLKYGPCLLTLRKGSRHLVLKAWIFFSESFKMKCLRELLRTSYSEHKTNDWVRSKINSLVGPQEHLLATVKRWKLAWSGHVTRHNSLSRTILQGTLEGWWHCGQQRQCWLDNIKEWTSLPMPELFARASCGKDWKRISAKSSFMSPQWPSQSRDWTELNWGHCVLLKFGLQVTLSYTVFKKCGTLCKPLWS